MNAAPSLVFSRIHFTPPVNPDAVVAMLERLASDPSSSELVFETRADASGISTLVGCAPTSIHRFRLRLTHSVPGVAITGLGDRRRLPVSVARRITFGPDVLPLNTEDPLRLTRAIYSALAKPLHDDDTLVLQLRLGAGQGPRVTPPKVPDPTRSWLWSSLTGSHKEAPTEVRNSIRNQAAQFRLECAIRVGAAAGTPARRKALVTDLVGALSLARSPGVHVSLAVDDPSRLNEPGRLGRSRLHLTAADLTALLGWPLGEEQLPGMPPLHPKLLRAAPTVHTKTRVFARSDVPGDARPLGLTEASSLSHGLAIGPTGSGKTTALYHLIEADIAAGRAVVVLDPKDQMPDHLAARIPARRWDDVVIIDPRDARPIGFNPLDATGRDPDVVADGLLAVFARTFESSWGVRTEDILSASLRTLARASSSQRPNTLLDLPRLWTDNQFRSTQLARVSDDPGLMSFWSAYLALSPVAQAAWIASPMNKLRQILLRPAAVKILGQANPRFHLRDVFRDRKIVLVALNDGLIGPLTAQLIGSLVIAEIWQATQERAAEKDASKHPGFVYVDEADRFMHLPISLGDALARSRSLSVGWFLAVQYWDQLPRDMRSAIKSNARTKIAWAMSSDDDARTFARLAPSLSEQDFMALGRFQVYANLVADGMPTGWASARTLPPSKAFSDPAAVRARSHALFGPPAPSDRPQPSAHPNIESSPAESPTMPGRRRRSS